ncbi:MAG: PID-CTERM protein-sorting domain-containing protein [Bacteroidia bacterium]
MRKKVILFILVAFSGIEKIAAVGAPPPPPGGGMDPPCWPPPCVPVDNGVIFLILAGVAYAAKKFYDYKKQKRNSLIQ